jgi:thiol-disulfide isomerase/thioredoxin
MKTLGFVLGAAALACGLWLTVDLDAGAASEARAAQTPLLLAPGAGQAMPSLEGAVEWLNSKPLGAAELRGKVVLVDFWTYSCINWQRTLPYLAAWDRKYRAQGLVVIGVHTPEFEFEKDIDRVSEATGQLRVGYPVAVDSDAAVWRAFHNAYWPALYIVDAKGVVRHHHVGEGGYEQSERAIQQLLAEAGAQGVASGLVQVDGPGSQAPADWRNLRSPESYVGHARAENFASPGGFARNRSRAYEAPAAGLRLNGWALAGNWTVGAEAARLDRAGGRIVYRFHARDLHLVMGPATGGQPVPFRVRIDGKPPGTAHGADVDADGRGVLVQTRLYQLIRQDGPITDRRFEIEFDAPGAQAYSFTFG